MCSHNILLTNLKLLPNLILNDSSEAIFMCYLIKLLNSLELHPLASGQSSSLLDIHFAKYA